MRWQLVLTLAVCLFAATVGTTAAHGPWRYAGTDAGCMRLMWVNGAPLGSAEADWLGNYHGCDEVYNASGRLVGYGRGTSHCDRLAYQYAIGQGLTGEQYHAAMAGQCVLYEDLSWGAE